MSPVRFLSRRELACRKVVALLTDYLEGARSTSDQRRLERHLSACPHCTEFLAQLNDTIRAAGQIEHDAIDDEVRDELIAMYRRFGSE